MNETENDASYKNITKRNSQQSLPVSVQNLDSLQGTRFEPHKFYAEIDIVQEAFRLQEGYKLNKPLLSGYLRNNLNSVKSIAELSKSLDSETQTQTLSVIQDA